MVGTPTGIVDISGGGSVSDVQGGPSGCVARVEFQNDGDIQAITAGSTDVGDWITPKAAAPGAYEIHAHQNSGDALAASDALDTWLALTSTRGWGVEVPAPGPGAKAANLTIQIRLGGVVLSSGVFLLSAEVTP